MIVKVNQKGGRSSDEQIIQDLPHSDHVTNLLQSFEKSKVSPFLSEMKWKK